MTLRDQLRLQWSELPAGLRSVGRLVLDEPGFVVTDSMRTVAARAGMAPSALVRFAQHLGFAGWPALKQALATEMGLIHQPYMQRASALRERKAERTLADEVFDTQQENVRTAAGQSMQALDQAARQLQRAKAVHVAGYRSCFGPAASFVYVYSLMRAGVRLMDSLGGRLEAQRHAIAPGDAVLAISFAPYSREAVAVARHARQVKARLIALTDSTASPLALHADTVLLFSTRSPSFFHPRWVRQPCSKRCWRCWRPSRRSLPSPAQGHRDGAVCIGRLCGGGLTAVR
jgi:DNA-binding MurR/RpiR family transcriptional regulator